MESANSAGVKSMAPRLYEVRQVIFSAGASINSSVPRMASSMYIMGRRVWADKKPV